MEASRKNCGGGPSGEDHTLRDHELTENEIGFILPHQIPFITRISFKN